MRHKYQRITYLSLFLLLLLTEIVIALFVHDDIVRPYVGDAIVTVLLCSLVRIFFPRGLKLLPLWVCLFAFAVEIGQLFDVVSLIGLGDVAFFRILVGSTFSYIDLVCYAAGCAFFLAVETVLKKYLFTAKPNRQ